MTRPMATGRSSILSPLPNHTSSVQSSRDKLNQPMRVIHSDHLRVGAKKGIRGWSGLRTDPSIPFPRTPNQDPKTRESKLMIPLRDHLLQAYGGFANRRHKDPSQDHAIKIDDQNGDVTHLFCQLFVQVPERNGTSFTLTMHNAPLSLGRQ